MPLTDDVHLPAAIADEFGIDRSAARLMVGLGKVFIDDELWDGDGMDIPRAEVAGKTVEVRGDVRSVRFVVPE